MNSSLISIIIPTYNRAHLIGETLDSIIAQTYKNWECIVVDDGSTDITANVLKEYCLKDTRIQYHHRPDEHKPGGNGARNYGFKLSKGDYVNWFDSDDLMSHDKLEKQLKDLKNEFDMSVCATGNFTASPNDFYVIYGQNIHEYDGLLSFFSLKFRWLTQSPLIAANFLKNHDITFREELTAGQEFCYFCELLFFKPRVTVSPDIYVSRRVSSDSISMKSKSNLQFEYFKSREYFIENYRSVLKNAKLQTYWINYVINFFRLSLENRNFIEAQKVLRLHLHKHLDSKFILFRLYIGLVSYFIFNKGFKIINVKIN